MMRKCDILIGRCRDDGLDAQERQQYMHALGPYTIYRVSCNKATVAVLVQDCQRRYAALMFCPQTGLVGTIFPATVVHSVHPEQSHYI